MSQRWGVFLTGTVPPADSPLLDATHRRQRPLQPGHR